MPCRKRDELQSRLRVQFISPPPRLLSLIPPPPSRQPFPLHFLFLLRSVASSFVLFHIFESPFAARLARGGTERGVNEEPQVARKGRPFFAPGGNSIRRPAGRPTDRPVDPAVARDFHGVTRFPADITFDIYTRRRWRSDQPRSIGTTPLRYGDKPQRST